MYLPNSVITKKFSPGGQFVFKNNKFPFKGDYIKTNKGKYYAGHNNFQIDITGELIESEEFSRGDTIPKYAKKTISQTQLAKNFGKDNPSTLSFLSRVVPLPVAKNIPNEKDYIKGTFKRYFAKRINSFKYLEIDKKTYLSLSNKEGKYDHNLYEIGSLNWYLLGNNVYKRNSVSIKNAQINFPNIFYLFPILNEFMAPTTEIQENLKTDGGELYYGDGTEYVGYYHIHPLKGPMEGALHNPSPHPYLYYINQLPQVGDTSYLDFLNGYNKITCYKCLTISISANTGPGGTREENKEIVSIKRSRLLGCPKGSTTSFQQAHNDCFPPIVPPETNTTDTRPDVIVTTLGDGVSVPLHNGTCGWGMGDDFWGSLFDYIPPGPGGYNYGSGAAGWGGAGGGGTGGGSGGGVGDFFGNCFTPNTLVTMADGTEKTISSIKKGEKVKSEKGESTVLDIQIHEGNFNVYSFNGGKPFVTEEHPFKTIDGWRAINPFTTFEKHQIASDVLNIDDIIYKIDGKEIIKTIEKGKITYKKVYNLVLDNEHVYYANGYLVHNDKGQGTTLDDLIAMHEENRPGDGFDFGDIVIPNFGGGSGYP